jgi:cytochrome c
MKKNLIYLAAFTFFLSSCGDAKKEPEASTASETETKTAPPPVATRKNGISQEESDKGLALIATSDCLTCHKLTEKFVGPSYREVSNRYTAHPDTINKLATKIIKGGAGSWGPVPMTPHPQLSKDDAVQMVKYVLGVE